MSTTNGIRDKGRVAIVGAGPVGLVAALYLARMKVPFVVFEAEEKLSDAAKAGTLTPRSLEIFSQVGVIDDILAAGLRLDTVDFVERRQDKVLMRMPLNELDKDTAYPFTINLPQGDYEKILHEHVVRSGMGEVLFSHRATAVEQDEDGCRLTVERPGGIEEFEAAYVLACDGGRSTMRRMLGIKHEGITYPEKFALIDVEADLDSDEERRPTYLSYIFDPEEWLVLVRQPHMWRVLWPVHPDASEPSEVEILERLRRAVGDRPMKVLGAINYKVHHRVAEHFRVRRIFLLGDAAHLITPLGALGASTGFQDANNLPWKIAWVMKGLADPALLDTYERERRPIAEFIAGGLADRNRSMMSMKNPVGRVVRDLVIQAMQRSPAHRWNTAYLRSLLSTSYRGEVQRKGFAERLLRSFLPEAHPAVAIGDRAPDARLFGPDGRPHQLHELVGTTFLALTFDDARDEPHITPLDEQPPFLRHYLVSWADAPHDTGLRDRAFYDIGGALARRFHAKPGSTYLIRPDGHVSAIEPRGGRTAREVYEDYVGMKISGLGQIAKEAPLLAGSR